jgi:hypothetical protein
MSEKISLWIKERSYNPKTISFEVCFRALFLHSPGSTSLVYMRVIKNLIPKIIVNLALVGPNELIQNWQQSIDIVRKIIVTVV